MKDVFYHFYRYCEERGLEPTAERLTEYRKTWDVAGEILLESRSADADAIRAIAARSGSVPTGGAVPRGPAFVRALQGESGRAGGPTRLSEAQTAPTSGSVPTSGDFVRRLTGRAPERKAAPLLESSDQAGAAPTGLTLVQRIRS